MLSASDSSWSSMTFESAGSPGNGNGCFVLMFSQWPVHTSNPPVPQQNKTAIVWGSPVSFSLLQKFSIIRRLPDCFSRKKCSEMRELGMRHGRTSCVWTRWRFIIREIILMKLSLKCFCITAFLKCTLFQVPSLIDLQVVLSSLVFSTSSEMMNSFWPELWWIISRAQEKHLLIALLIKTIQASFTVV